MSCEKCDFKTVPAQSGVCLICIHRKNKKPQLGVTPRFIWEEQRLTDIKEAIERRTSTFENIPIEWTNEYNELVEKIERRK